MLDRDELDRLLDAALATYAVPKHDSGLERRVLERIGAARTPVQHRWLWAAGIPALAASLLLLFAVFAPWRHTSHELQKIDPPMHPLVAEAPHPARPRHIAHTMAHVETTGVRRAPRPGITPKLDVFPTPVPLSGQERALVRYVTEAPEAQRNDLMEAQQRSIAPLGIAAISIPPIEPPNKGSE
ncbi:MAG TPA: hypothetical protein VK716_13465 [Terracidiphilus sp.]|jgi:hypothetical protein|nr:hypothetical protein [Terracidiphilus sp.]